MGWTGSLENQKGGILLPVIGISIAAILVGLQLFRQSEGFIRRGQYDSLLEQKNVQLNSELKYILSKPNCGIVDLDDSLIVKVGSDQFLIKRGLRSDIQGGIVDLKEGTRFLGLTIKEIFISPFDPKLFESSMVGNLFNEVVINTKEFVPLGSENLFLAKFNLVTTTPQGAQNASMISSFPVIVGIKDGSIYTCRGVNEVIAVKEMCDQFGGSWDEMRFECAYQTSQTSVGAVEHCPFNEVCNADSSFRF